MYILRHVLIFQESYADKMIVMYDSNSIKHIGLVWKPGCFNPAPAEVIILCSPPQYILSFEEKNSA